MIDKAFLPPMCDPLTGVCLVPDVAPGSDVRPAVGSKPKVHYIGDPMCSWCWGISPALNELHSYCVAHDVAFEITLGGLRAGGGDEWNSSFKQFLRQEWSDIHEVTGQPFGFGLLELPYFDYDTEPACRAVVAVRTLVEETSGAKEAVLEFFSAVQRKFYVETGDPKEVEFYRSVCHQLGINFDAFADVFASDGAMLETVDDFARSRAMGVRAFPTILVEYDGGLTEISRGSVTAEQLIRKLKLFVGER
ncbi:DsbA family protein [Burkholderia sp. MSMB1826]|uniref:DsbA family protein n=1 Tax=Burkholderia sp. MSMB1826 TaxID=1637875 RepID=UPI000AC4376D|nr:DsbA family protein [Burkholderia sp. MSMB1826]